MSQTVLIVQPLRAKPETLNVCSMQIAKCSSEQAGLGQMLCISTMHQTSTEQWLYITALVEAAKYN